MGYSNYILDVIRITGNYTGHQLSQNGIKSYASYPKIFMLLLTGSSFTYEKPSLRVTKLKDGKCAIAGNQTSEQSERESDKSK